MSDTPSTPDDLKDRIVAALRQVRDPEIPVNLYDLGLIYDLAIETGGDVQIRMTLTTPNCPVAEQIPAQVQQAVEQVDGVESVRVSLVWEPPWTRDMMHEDARALLEMMGVEWADHPAASRLTSLTVGRASKRSNDHPRRG